MLCCVLFCTVFGYSLQNLVAEVENCWMSGFVTVSIDGHPTLVWSGEARLCRPTFRLNPGLLHIYNFHLSWVLNLALSVFESRSQSIYINWIYILFKLSLNKMVRTKHSVPTTTMPGTKQASASVTYLYLHHYNTQVFPDRLNGF